MSLKKIDDADVDAVHSKLLEKNIDMNKTFITTILNSTWNKMYANPARDLTPERVIERTVVEILQSLNHTPQINKYQDYKLSIDQGLIKPTKKNQHSFYYNTFKY